MEMKYYNNEEKALNNRLNQYKDNYFADIKTYLETCSRNGVNEFTALLRLTQGQPYTVKELLGEI